MKRRKKEFNWALYEPASDRTGRGFPLLKWAGVAAPSLGQQLERGREEALRRQGPDGGHPLTGDGGQARMDIYGGHGTGQGAPEPPGAGARAPQDEPLPDEAEAHRRLHETAEPEDP